MDDLLTIKEAAAQMKVAERTIRRWIAQGRLQASKIARTVRIRREALEALAQTGVAETRVQYDVSQPQDLEGILSILRRQMPLLRSQYGVDLLGIFGSYRRGEQTPTSDLDLLVAFREVPGLLKYIGLENYLSDLVGIKVDLVMGDALKSRVGQQVRQEVALV